MIQNFECTTASLPFFPKYETHNFFGSDLQVTWFERDFSQSRYYSENGGGSNACTLIAVLLASKCFSDKIQMFGPDRKINHFLVRALGVSMLEGNELYEQLKNKGKLVNINLTVPEGIRFTGLKNLGLIEWKSNLYLQSLEDTLYKNLKEQWIEWMHSPAGKKYQNLYVVLICDARSVIIIMQSDNLDTVTLVDSHQHTSGKGAVIAVSARSKMKYLCQWFGKMVQHCYQSSPSLYELSFLYFRKRNRSKDTSKKEVF